MKVILSTVGFVWLFYLATLFFLKYQSKQTGNMLSYEFYKRGITLSYFSFNKSLHWEHESTFRASRYRFSQFLVFPAVVLYFLLLPIMVYTVVTFFSSSLPKMFTFSFPEGSVLAVLSAFLLSALVHEVGHFCVALLNGADIYGFGLGATFGFPHFYVYINNTQLLESYRKNVALGGAAFNILLTALGIGLSWLVFACTKPGISTPLGYITYFNGISISNVADFNRTLSYMKDRFYRYSFIIDNQNIMNAPVHRKTQAPDFGALKVPLYLHYQEIQQNGDAVLFLLTQQLVYNKFITILKPIVPYKPTVQLLNAAKYNPEFCSASEDGYLCILPAAQNGEMGFFVRAVVDGELQTLQTSFGELESMQKINGGNGLSQMRVLATVNDWLYLLSASSIGVAAVSLLVFPQTSDGAKVLDVFEAKLKVRIGVFSQLITGAVRGLSFVLFCGVLIGLCVTGIFGI